MHAVPSRTLVFALLCCFACPVRAAIAPPTPAELRAGKRLVRQLVRLQRAARKPPPESLAALAAFETALRQTTAARLHGVVQISHLPSPREAQVLAQRGIRLHSFLDQNAYRAAVSRTADLAAHTDAPFPIFATLLAPAEKVLPELVAGDFSSFDVPLPDGTAGNYVRNPDGSLNVVVVFAPDAAPTEEAGILGAHAVQHEALGEHQHRAVIPPSELLPLAANDAVAWVAAGPPPLLPANAVARSQLRVDPVQDFDPVACTFDGLSGEGIQVGIFDGGIDPDHDDLRELDGCDLGAASRIILSTDPNRDNVPHGTHVAGTVAGSGYRSDKTADDGSANGGAPFMWRGMAPRAQLIEGDENDITNMEKLHDAVVVAGMDVSNHSYVTALSGTYDTDAEKSDRCIRGDCVWLDDATGIEHAIAPRLQVYAAGNNGVSQQYGLLRGFFAILHGMKNALIVGSGNPTHLDSFSSEGPTHDGRIKPDVLGLGNSIVSLESSGGAACDPHGAPGVDNAYATCTGTSQATPTVTGTAALLLEAFLPEEPLPSTLRAILVHTARDVEDDNATGMLSPDTSAPVPAFRGPDFATGYGFVDAEAAADLARAPRRRILEDEIGTTCRARAYLFDVPEGATEVKVTLAWDDPAADELEEKTDPRLVNDLDLVLRSPDGTVYYPWLLDQLAQVCLVGGFEPGDGVGLEECLPVPDALQACGDSLSVSRVLLPAARPADDDPIDADDLQPAGNGRDHLNNLEQVVVDAPAPGLWSAEVTGFNVPQGPQSFSLVGIEPDDHDCGLIELFCDDGLGPGDLDGYLDDIIGPWVGFFPCLRALPNCPPCFQCPPDRPEELLEMAQLMKQLLATGADAGLRQAFAAVLGGAPVGFNFTGAVRAAALQSLATLQGPIQQMSQLVPLVTALNALDVDARMRVYAPAYTKPGRKVRADVGNGVELKFQRVLRPGRTAGMLAVLGPRVPSGFSVGLPGVVYEVGTTAVTEGAVTVAIHYGTLRFSGPAQGLRLFHEEGGQLVDRTLANDTAARVLTAQVTLGHPSRFVVLEPTTQP